MYQQIINELKLLLKEASAHGIDHVERVYQTAMDLAEKECADKETSVDLVQTILIHKDLENAEKEIAQGFVQLGRMLWFSLAAKLKDKAPWKACHISVNL